MDIKWGKQRREAFAKKESKLLVTAKGLEVSLHLVWDCLCRVASGLVAATFSSWAPLCSSACLSGELLGNSIAVSAVQALLASLVGSTWRVSVGVKTERKKCSPVSSWDRHVQRDAELVACWLGSSAAASTNRAVLGFSNNPCSSAWKGSDLAFASVHTGCFSNASCLPQNSVSESPNYLLRKPADCLHQACASRGRRQSFSERLMPSLLHRNWYSPSFPSSSSFFFFVLRTSWSWYCFFPDVSREAEAKYGFLLRSRKCVLARNAGLPFSGLILNRNQIILRSCTKSFLKNSLLAPCMWTCTWYQYKPLGTAAVIDYG